VRRHEQRALKRLEELLQPDDGFQIKVVGRFVHQQHIGTAKKNAGQRDAHFPSTGKRAYIAINLIIFEAEAVKYLARLRFKRVSAKMLILFLDFAKARKHTVHLIGFSRIGHFMLQCFQLMMKIAHASAAGNGFVND
jgi:hypothetical protein